MTPAQRRELTDRQHRHLSIVRQCQLMGVSRSSLYYRPKGTPPGDLSLMQAMDRQYLETPFYGSRRMKASLDRQGMTVPPSSLPIRGRGWAVGMDEYGEIIPAPSNLFGNLYG